MDFLYGSLKVISMIATGVFGALALLTKYRDDNDKITKWGKLALGGILVSSGISLGLYILEISKAKDEAEKAKQGAERAQRDAEQTSQLLNNIFDRAKNAADGQEETLKTANKLQSDMVKNLKKQDLSLTITDKIAQDMNSSIFAQRVLLADNKRILTGVTDSVTKQTSLLNQTQDISLDVKRSLFPIEEFKASFTFTIPLSHPAITNYITYLETQLTRLLPQLREEKKKDGDKGYSNIEGFFISENNSDLDVSLYPPSSHFPSYETKEGKFLNRKVFIVQFYKPPFDINEIRNHSGKPDLEIWVTAFVDAPNKNSNEMSFIFDKFNSKQEGRLLKRAYFVNIGDSTQTGRIPSLLEFGGTLLVVRFVDGLDKMVELTDLRLHQTRGRCFKIDGKLFQRIDGYELKQGMIILDSQQPTILFQELPSDLKMTTDCSPPSL